VNGIPFPFRDGMRDRAMLLGKRKLQQVVTYRDVAVIVFAGTQMLGSLVTRLFNKRQPIETRGDP
jgi:hypothetical protein